MVELLKVNYDEEQPTVSARDLHDALGIKERFSLCGKLFMILAAV